MNNRKKFLGYYYEDLKDLSFWEIIWILYIVFMPSFFFSYAC